MNNHNITNAMKQFQRHNFILKLTSETNK